MRRALVWAAVAAVVVFSLAVSARPTGPKSPDEQVAAIASGLRCPVCQGLSVADSDSQTARDLRSDIARRIDDGENAATIRQAYVERYGEWVLLRPPARGFGAIVWVIPPLAAGVGAAVVVVALWRWRRRRPAVASDDDRRLVDEALARAARTP